MQLLAVPVEAVGGEQDAGADGDGRGDGEAEAEGWVGCPGLPAFDPANPAPYWIAAAQIYNGLRGCSAPIPMTVALWRTQTWKVRSSPGAVGDSDTAFNIWQWHCNGRGNEFSQGQNRRSHERA